MKNIFDGKTILVTGGCGSIGTEIVQQLIPYNPTTIRVLDNNESGHFLLNQKIKSHKIRNLIGDIRDKDRVSRAMEEVDIVFHAAALKHVPFCEYNPFEAVSTNVIGTKNVVDVSIQEGVERFIGISTDKAVNPINTMGATKLLSEKIITNAPIGKSKVKFCCVRFGNVLNSNGSVIPIFKHQIQKGGPLEITSEHMTRFFMSINEAVKLVLKAATLTKGGETFILKMPAMRIVDLAQALINRLAAKDMCAENIERKNIGLRPGEKIYETLMSNEEAIYMRELDDMFVLHNSLLANHLSNGTQEKCLDVGCSYDSHKTSLLSVEEIEEILIKENIA